MDESSRNKFGRRGALKAAAGVAVAGWLWRPGSAAAGETAAGLDTLSFGDADSELSHGFSANLSDTVSGALGQPARVFKPAAPASYWGGTASFTMRCVPSGPTYVTIKLWGGDFAKSENETWRLQYFVEGKLLGYLDQGAVDSADLLDAEPRTPGRFFFHTLPLPEKFTRGKTRVSLELRSHGRIWPYGQNAAQLYYPMTSDSRPVYRVYTHRDPYFVPGADDVQGPAPVPTPRTTPGNEVLDAVRARVLKDQDNYLNRANPFTLDGWAFQQLAEGYLWPDGPAYRQPAALDRVCQAIDGRYGAWLKDDTVLTASDQQWQGFGRVGLVLALLWNDLGDRLDAPVQNLPAGTLAPARREAYTTMLVSSRDYWRQHFPHYSNQSQICAIGLYQAYRGLRLLAPDLAQDEAKARDYLYQSIGIKPYLGPETADGVPTKPLGDSYYQVTRTGLTRELGYVGNYGEVTDWLLMMYESVTRGVGGQEAPELREQILKIIKTRGWFRYFDVDADGHRVARIESVVGWRNEVYPGEVCYAMRTAWDSHPAMAAAVLGERDVVGWTQEMVADGQFLPELDLLLTNSSARVGLNAFRLIARDWPAFQALPASPSRLPTNWDAPDFLFTDEENAVVAVKRGQELFFAELYFRARQGVNGFGRVHLVRPGSQLSATVLEDTVVRATSNYTVNDWVCWDYAINDPAALHIPPGGFPPPGPALQQAAAGDLQPLNRIPADIPDPTLGVHRPGVETMLVGRADFYRLAYGRYLIGLNTTEDTTHELRTTGPGYATDLRTGRRIRLGGPIRVPPRTTVVLYLGG